MDSSRRSCGCLDHRVDQVYSKNIYGVTKAVVEDHCQLLDREPTLFCNVLRTSRFFSEEDHGQVVREG